MSVYDEGGIAVARELIPARARRTIYAAASLAGLALTAAVVGFTAVSQTVPDWLTATLAVLGALTAPLGMLAASNVAAAPTPPPILGAEEEGADGA